MLSVIVSPVGSKWDVDLDVFFLYYTAIVFLSNEHQNYFPFKIHGFHVCTYSFFSGSRAG